MPTPGFPPGILDAEGKPVWIGDLAEKEPHHSLHVVRGLEPAEALELLGARRGLFRPCEIPSVNPQAWVQAADGDAYALLAGRVGDWVFVYDRDGATAFDADSSPIAVFAKKLSGGGREAASATVTFEWDADFGYAVDGEVLVHETDCRDLDRLTAEPALPAGLRAAIAAAGSFETPRAEEGEPDAHVVMRAVVALAGMAFGTDELRRHELIATPFG